MGRAACLATSPTYCASRCEFRQADRHDVDTSGNERQPALINIRAAASRLNIGVSTLRRKIKAGEVPAYRMGGPGTAIRLDPVELDAWLRAPEPGDAPGGEAA
jgi:excisionase family DNA binding protein